MNECVARCMWSARDMIFGTEEIGYFSRMNRWAIRIENNEKVYIPMIRFLKDRRWTDDISVDGSQFRLEVEGEGGV